MEEMVPTEATSLKKALLSETSTMKTRTAAVEASRSETSMTAKTSMAAKTSVSSETNLFDCTTSSLGNSCYRIWS